MALLTMSSRPTTIKNGNTVFSSIYDYYTQILAASHLFVNMEVLPVSVCQAFIDSLDDRLMPGFCTHFPNYSNSQDRAATHQRTVLQKMLQAALHAKTEYNNIRAIASETSGLGGQAFSAQANTSQAEKAISKCSDDNGSNKSGGLFKGQLRCHGCDGPHPWSLLKHGIHVIKSPNANNPEIQENAKKVINCIRSKRKRKQQDLSKRKNLAATNFSNFDAASQERIWSQVLNCPTETASIASSITSMTGATSATSPATSTSTGCGRSSKPVVFLYNAQALNTGVHCPVLLVTIN
jgi:hypothetical protein